MIEETVGYDEETVAFNNAVKEVKKNRRLFYKAISERIGLTIEQGKQIRAGKRRASNLDILNLIKHYPETLKFFPNYENDTSALEQTLNEPMGTHFYGKSTDHRDELIDLQKKLIARLELELAEVKEKLKVVEAERKTLIEIVSQRK
jgi:hypothetical protein